MKKILLLYYSRHGSVKQLSTHLAAGVESVEGCEAVIRTVPPVSTVSEAVAKPIAESGDVFCNLQDLEHCDGLALGSPTRFGTVAAPLKYFFDQTTSAWLAGTLSGKPAAVFTSSGTMHGGQESTLLAMMLPLIHHGMIMVGIPFSGSALHRTVTGGTPYGASHVAGGDSTRPVSRDEAELARLLGQRLARCAQALHGAGV